MSRGILHLKGVEFPDGGVLQFDYGIPLDEIPSRAELYLLLSAHSPFKGEPGERVWN